MLLFVRNKKNFTFVPKNGKDMELDPQSGVPLHRQAEEILRKLIESEEYKHGKMLPREVDLANQLNISRNTLRQAINQLVFEGLLVRKKGVGTKVAHKGILGGLKNWRSFSQEMKMLGVEIRNYELVVNHRRPTPEIAAFFGIREDRQCVVMERVRGNLSFPFVRFISYFNPDLPLSGDENFTRPLYDMLEETYGIVVKTSREEVRAALAGEEIAAKLGIHAKDPVLIRKRFVYDMEDRPVEYNIGYYRADSFTYTLESTR